MRMEPERRVAGTVSIEHFNLGPLVPPKSGRPATRVAGRRANPLTSDITGEARIDLALPGGRLPLSGTYAVNAGTVQVAGYEARNVVANGRIDGTTIRVNATAAPTVDGARLRERSGPASCSRWTFEGRAAGVDLRNLPASLNVPRGAEQPSVRRTR